ncbi:MAG: succinylglutamate desuccinylase/aspartoacylase family protein [Gammaproteobacteria bacterium]|jgi:predicted deacylase
MTKKDTENHSITINNIEVKPGTHAMIDLPISPLYTRTPINMSIHVVNGAKPGPRLFITSAIHGDELNGVEIIRRLLKLKLLNHLSGTVIAIPIVNIFGFIYRSRYLPDRRDLNRSFPGSKTGSMAARIADLLLEEVVSKCTHGIDLHTGAVHRSNWPQVRANLNDTHTCKLAHAFGTPVLINGLHLEGSLRGAAVNRGIPTLLYEAGEALRIDEFAIHVGVRGILNVMRELKMLKPKDNPEPVTKPVIAQASQWIRANEAGLFLDPMPLGEKVKKGDTLGIIANPITGEETPITSPVAGIIIGVNHLPLVNEGEALFHIVTFKSFKSLEKVNKELKAFEYDFLQDSDLLLSL